MTSSNGNIFRVIGPRWIPHTKASDAELWCFFDLHPNKRLSKRWWGWWFETPSCPLCLYCNVINLDSCQFQATTIQHIHPYYIYIYIYAHSRMNTHTYVCVLNMYPCVLKIHVQLDLRCITFYQLLSRHEQILTCWVMCGWMIIRSQTSTVGMDK